MQSVRKMRYIKGFLLEEGSDNSIVEATERNNGQVAQPWARVDPRVRILRSDYQCPTHEDAAIERA